MFKHIFTTIIGVLGIFVSIIAILMGVSHPDAQVGFTMVLFGVLFVMFIGTIIWMTYDD